MIRGVTHNDFPSMLRGAPSDQATMARKKAAELNHVLVERQRVHASLQNCLVSRGATPRDDRPRTTVHAVRALGLWGRKFDRSQA